MIQVRTYDLPDFEAYHSSQHAFSFWSPDQKYIVLGAANNAQEALHAHHVLADEIPVYKRPTGGQTVVLSPEMLVISVMLVDKNEIHPKEVFKSINAAIISSLQSLGVENLLYRGISDIAIGEYKILGSSMCRKSNKTFYHAVLNMGEPAETFERYLKHPSKEPDYRNGRRHSDFVTSLKQQGYAISAKEIMESLNDKLVQFSREVIGDR